MTGCTGTKKSIDQSLLTDTVSSIENASGSENAEGQGREAQNQAVHNKELQDQKIQSSGIQSAEIPSATREIFAMDTYMTITGYGEQCEEAVEAAVAEVERLDALLSVGSEESEIGQINLTGSGHLSEETAMMVEKSLELYQDTKGAFDITIYPMMALWGFTTGNFRVPEEEEIAETLKLVDCGSLIYDSGTRLLTLGERQGIDLGAIAKGFTSNRLMEIFEEYDLLSGVVSLGGNVQCYGTKTDGSLWRCGIQNPLNPESGNVVGIVQVSDCAVITSGGYERYFTDEATGKTYHHILDPSTGISADSDLLSVTIVSPDGMLADGLSTACFILGLEKATDLWREKSDSFDMVLVTTDEKIYVTEPLTSCFSSKKEVNIISGDK